MYLEMENLFDTMVQQLRFSGPVSRTKIILTRLPRYGVTCCADESCIWLLINKNVFPFVSLEF